MKANIIQAFVAATREVLTQEIGEPIESHKPRLQAGPYRTQDIAVLIGVAQAIEGAVILSLSQGTALRYVSHVMGETIDELDELAQSGIGELANVIAGRAGVMLAAEGYETVIAPPTMIIGAGTMVSTLNVPRLVVLMETPIGAIEVQLAAKEGR